MLHIVWEASPNGGNAGSALAKYDGKCCRAAFTIMHQNTPIQLPNAMWLGATPLIEVVRENGANPQVMICQYPSGRQRDPNEQKEKNPQPRIQSADCA